MLSFRNYHLEDAQQATEIANEVLTDPFNCLKNVHVIYYHQTE